MMVSRGEVVGRVRPQDEHHLDAAHEFAFQFGRSLLGHTHVVVEFDGDHDVLATLIVVVDGTHDADGVAVGVDGIRHAEAVDVLELDVVGVGRLKHVDPFQEVNSYEEEHQGYDSGECNLDFFGKVFHLFFSCALASGMVTCWFPTKATI